MTRLVFFSKSPSTGLVRNHLQSLVHVLTIYLMGVISLVMFSLFCKKYSSKTSVKTEILTSPVLGLFEKKTRHVIPSCRPSKKILSRKSKSVRGATYSKLQCYVLVESGLV